MQKQTKSGLSPRRDGRKHRYCMVRYVEPEDEDLTPLGSYEVDYGGRKAEVWTPVQLDSPDPRYRHGEEHPMRGGVALKVGRHQKQLGMVFLVRLRKSQAGRYYERGSRERGLVEWDHKTKASLVEAVTKLALKYAGFSKPGGDLVSNLATEWQTLPYWEDLMKRKGIGKNIDLIREVMET